MNSELQTWVRLVHSDQPLSSSVRQPEPLSIPVVQVQVQCDPWIVPVVSGCP